MPETGRVAVWTGLGKPIAIREYAVPDPEPGAILVKIRLAGICGSDLHGWRGDNPQVGPVVERAMGHEMSGTVHKLGAGVTTDSLGRPLKEGDRICYMQVFPCYRCHVCAKGEFNVCPNRQFGGKPAGEWPYFTGAFADYFYLPPRHWVYKVPDDLADEAIVPVNCAMGTVMQGLTTVGVALGDSVVIQGAGGLGLAATAIARHMGASDVIVIDRLDNRLALAREFGATHTINITDLKTPDERVDHVWELTGRRGADLVVELAGIPDLMVEGVEMLGAVGTFLEIGNLVPGAAEFRPRSLLRGNGWRNFGVARRIIASQMYKPDILPKVLNFMVENLERYPFQKLSSHKFALDDINSAFESAEWANRQTDVIRAAVAP